MTVDVHPDVVRLHDAGRDVGEIAHELGMSRFAVRRMVNQLDPPHHGVAPLIPPGKGPEAEESIAARDAMRDHEAKRTPFAVDQMREHSRRINGAKRAPCGTETAWRRHRKYWQTCPTCEAAHTKRRNTA